MKLCKECHKKIQSNSSLAMFCCGSCRAKHWYRLNKNKPGNHVTKPKLETRKRRARKRVGRIKYCANQECNMLFYQKTPTQKCCCRECVPNILEGGFKPIHTKDKKAELERERCKRRRRKMRNGIQVDRLAIFKRDNWTCGICKNPIDANIKWPDPMSKSIDHILPISLGGEDVPENCQAAHLGCNSRKAAGTKHRRAAVKELYGKHELL